MAKVSLFFISVLAIRMTSCFVHRTMLNLLSPRLDLIDGSRTVGRFDDVSGAPVIVTGYAYEDVERIERMVNERSRWFAPHASYVNATPPSRTLIGVWKATRCRPGRRWCTG